MTLVDSTQLGIMTTLQGIVTRTCASLMSSQRSIIMSDIIFLIIKKVIFTSVYILAMLFSSHSTLMIIVSPAACNKQPVMSTAQLEYVQY